MTRPLPPLWDSSHPYYAQPGNYFDVGLHEEYNSWKEFIEEKGDDDLDLNMVYRWDWLKPTEHDDDDDVTYERVMLFYIQQRRAICSSVEVRVTKEDEPAVKKWLAVRWNYIQNLWSPISE